MKLKSATAGTTTSPGFGRWSLILGLALISTLGGQPNAAPIDCSTWQLINPLPTDRDLHGVAYQNGHYVVVGDEGTVLISENEVGWTQVTPPSAQNFNSVIGHDEDYLVVGDAGVFVTGRPGGDWTVGTTPTTANLFDLASNSGPTIVAVGTGGTIVTTFDLGNTWAEQTSGTDASLYGVVWTGAEFIAAGSRGTILTSSDGLSWSQVDVGIDSKFSAIETNGSLTVAITEDGRAVMTTGDGQWSTHPAPHRVTDIAWVGDRFLTVGGNTPRYSFDAQTWNGSRVSGPGLEFESVGPSTESGSAPLPAIAVGPGGTIAHSTDGGKHWKPANTVSGLDFFAMASNGSVAVAAAGTDTESEGAILASDDLINWEVVYWMDLETIYDVAAGDDRFMAVGVVNELWAGGSLILSSPDGSEWDSAIHSASGSASRPWAFHSITWDGSRWVAGGTTATLAVSDDGTNWHFMAIEDDAPFLGVASNQQVIVAVGAVGWVAVSEDGLSLTTVDIDCNQPLSGAAWGNGVFVAVGGRGSILSSHDGLTWDKHTSGTLLDLNTVRWTGEAFVAVGDKGFALQSPDGLEWDPIDRGTETDLWDMIVTPNNTVACGDAGLMMRLACSEQNQTPSAIFAWRPTLPEEGVPVHFMDLSTGNPTAWTWEFEDGTTADGPAVTHIFSDHGDWPVSLIVDNDDGSDSSTANVTVRRFCGAPPTTTMEAPESVTSGQPYTVSWNSVLNSWEWGEYIVVESRDPLFTDTSAFRLWDPQTSLTYSHRWTEGAVFYYTTYTINYCSDNSYYSDRALAAQVNIEPDISDLGDHVWVFPAATSGAGLKNTVWNSNVVIHNPHPFDAPAHLVFLPRAGEGDAAVGPRITIPAAASLRLEDALSPFGDVITGALLVASDRPLNVSSRVFNDRPEGTFGQFMAGAPVAGALEVGSEARLIQLTEDQDYRTNLALANPMADEAEAQLDFFSADGGLLGTSTYSVPGLASVFDSQVLRRFTQEPVADAFAVVSSPTPGGRLLAMASVVDNNTGDPMTQAAHTQGAAHRVVMVEPPTVIEFNDWNDLVFADGTWVAVGPDGLAISSDGLDWEMAVNLSSPQQRLWGLGFNGSQILAVGCNMVLSSTDGETWSAAEWPGGCLHSVTWNGSRWLAIGSDPGGNTTTIGTSEDGLLWQVREVSVDELRARQVIWADDRYVAATSTGIAYSSDGVHWTNVNIGLGIEDIAWNGSQFLALSLYDLATSSDGEEWQIQPMGRHLRRVVWAGDRWVVGAGPQVWGEHSVYLVSDNGNQWETLPRRGSGVVVEAMAWDGDTVLAIDYHGWMSFLVGDRSVVTVPAVAHTAGYGGSIWRSDLELHNPHETPIVCFLDLFKRGDTDHEPLSKALTLEASSSVRIPDVVSSLFSTSGSGALRITPSGGPVMVSSRTFDDGGEGTYGQLVPGLRSSDAIWNFESGRLIQLAHSPSLNTGFRTNMGLVNACSDPMHVTIDLHSGPGQHLGSLSVDLPPFGVEQLNNVFSQVTDSFVPDGFAVLATPTPQCSFYAYASVVDNRTNDPILVTAEPWHDDSQWLQMPAQ